MLISSRRRTRPNSDLFQRTCGSHLYFGLKLVIQTLIKTIFPTQVEGFSPIRRTIYPKEKPSHTNRDPSRKESSEKKGDGAAKSSAAVASGPGRNIGGGSSKGKEIISENIPDFVQQSKPNPNSNKLTLNIENGLYGRNKGMGIRYIYPLIYT